MTISIDIAPELVSAFLRSDLHETMDRQTIPESAAQGLSGTPPADQSQERGSRNGEQNKPAREVSAKNVRGEADECEDPDRRVADSPILLGAGGKVAPIV